MKAARIKLRELAEIARPVNVEDQLAVFHDALRRPNRSLSLDDALCLLNALWRSPKLQALESSAGAQSKNHEIACNLERISSELQGQRTDQALGQRATAPAAAIMPGVIPALVARLAEATKGARSDAARRVAMKDFFEENLAAMARAWVDEARRTVQQNPVDRHTCVEDYVSYIDDVGVAALLPLHEQRPGAIGEAARQRREQNDEIISLADGAPRARRRR